MTDRVEPLPVAGWYADPDAVATYRFWDGATWTERRWPTPHEQARDQGRSRFWSEFRLAAVVSCAVVALIAVFAEDDWPGGLFVAATLLLVVLAPDGDRTRWLVSGSWVCLWVLGALVHRGWWTAAGLAAIVGLVVLTGRLLQERRPKLADPVLWASMAGLIAYLWLVIR